MKWLVQADEPRSLYAPQARFATDPFFRVPTVDMALPQSAQKANPEKRFSNVPFLSQRRDAR